MRYEISLLEIYLRSDRSSSCWSRDMWRFDSTEHALVVGVPMGRSQAGSACVFGREGGSWSQRHRVAASDGEPGDCFGFQVAVEGNAMAVTAPFIADKRGAAYVYRWDGVVWTEEQKLVAPDGSEGELFGSSVDIAGEFVVVGAGHADGHGAAYVYRRMDSSWTVEQKLGVADDTLGDEFAYSVSMQDDEIIVGAPAADESGAAYVFRRKDGWWTQTQKLRAWEGGSESDFGRHVAHTLDDQSLIIGGSRADGQGSTRAVAHLFQRGDGLWCPVAIVEPTSR